MRLASAALEAGFHDIVVEPGFEDVARLGRFRVIHRQGDRFVADGAELGRLVAIQSPQGEKALRSAPPTHRHLVIGASDWKVIPLENLIAYFQGAARTCSRRHRRRTRRSTTERPNVGVLERFA